MSESSRCTDTDVPSFQADIFKLLLQLAMGTKREFETPDNLSAVKLILSLLYRMNTHRICRCGYNVRTDFDACESPK